MALQERIDPEVAEGLDAFFAITGPGGLSAIKDIPERRARFNALMAALEASELYDNEYGAWTFSRENPYDAKSRRERQCEAEGVPIWRLLYRRRLMRRPALLEAPLTAQSR